MTRMFNYAPKDGERTEQYIHGMTFENHLYLEIFKVTVLNGIKYTHIRYRSPRTWRWFTAFFVNDIMKEHAQEIVSQ